MRPRSGPKNTVSLPAGFSFSSACAGIKASGRADMALVEACPGTTAAAVFTKNRVVAAPLVVGRTALAASRGHLRAVIVNSGNANCATGKTGVKACERVCQQLGHLLGVPSEAVFPSSTGIIGVPLPMEKIISALPELAAGRNTTQQAIAGFATPL